MGYLNFETPRKSLAIGRGWVNLSEQNRVNLSERYRAYRETLKSGNGYYKMKYEIVGRKKELKKLDEIFASKEPEFLALYGRRRVGKPYWFDSNYHSGPGSKRVF